MKMVHGICHLEIPVTNIKRSGEFYNKLFGWKIEYMRNYALFMPEEGGLGGGLDPKEK